MMLFSERFRTTENKDNRFIAKRIIKVRTESRYGNSKVNHFPSRDLNSLGGLVEECIRTDTTYFQDAKDATEQMPG